MVRRLIAVTAAIALAGPAVAATGMCSKAPASKYQSKTKLESMLKHEGMKVRRIKTEGGCYEVYAIDKHGKKVNVAFNAETLVKVANAEAGESN